MRKMYQYRMYPTRKQQKALEAVLEECRWLYNETLAYRKDAWEQRQEHVSWYESKARIPLLKAERPSLTHVHSQVLQNVTERVELALQAFFRRVREKASEPGFPQSGFSITHDDRVCLSKIGSIEMVYHRPVRGNIKTLTIHKSSTGKWYASFSCEVEPLRLPERSEQVGIDVGLLTFATLSTGEEIANPRFFRKEEKALVKVQRKHSTLAKGTPEWHKQRKVVARVHERIAWRRDNFTHQASRSIVDRFGVIAVEDLTVNRMLHNHCLAKSIADASWSAFFSRLTSKAAEAGRHLVKVNPAYTSQTCSQCGHRQKITLNVRIFACPCCHVQLDRDLNAAYNILALGLQGGVIPEAPA